MYNLIENANVCIAKDLLACVQKKSVSVSLSLSVYVTFFLFSTYQEKHWTKKKDIPKTWYHIHEEDLDYS